MTDSKNLIPRNDHWVTIRLFASMAVMINHAPHVLWDANLDDSSVWGFFKNLQCYWMAVPILFFASGMLVSLSWRHSANWFEFFLKRILRVYPALWSCVLVSTVILLLLGHAKISTQFLMWFGAQMTLFQFWTPDMLRGYGVGAPNGSLWVIPVIFQSYLLCAALPHLDKPFRKFLGSYAPLLVLALAILSRQIYLYIDHAYGDALITKLLFVSIFPWFLFFYGGYLSVLYFEKIKNFAMPTLVLIAFYLVGVFLLNKFVGDFGGGNDVNSFVFLPLAFLLLKLAYMGDYRISFFTKVEKLLRKYDVTFGTFIFHMVVANVIHEYKLIDAIPLRLFLYFAATFVIAAFSLMVLEKPLRDNRDRIIQGITSRVFRPSQI